MSIYYPPEKAINQEREFYLQRALEKLDWQQFVESIAEAKPIQADEIMECWKALLNCRIKNRYTEDTQIALANLSLAIMEQIREYHLPDAEAKTREWVAEQEIESREEHNRIRSIY